MTWPAIKPRYVLATYLGMCFIFVIAASQSASNASIAMLCLVLCWESACFATIFTLGLRGLGRHTKIGGSFIVAAISGGAAFPPMTGALFDHLKKIKAPHSFHTAMLIPIMGFVCAWVYPVYVNIWNKETMDIRRTTDVGIVPVSEKEFDLQQTRSQGDTQHAARTLEETKI